MTPLGRVNAGLATLNTHQVGYVGLGAGGALIAAVAALFARLSDPKFLIDVLGEYETRTLGVNGATLLGLLFAVVGAALVAVLSSYFGRPYTIGKDAQPAIGTGAPDASAGAGPQKVT